jgi:ring-1,2-phenylacetyl-CoA epoxidase subunit PaaD
VELNKQTISEETKIRLLLNTVYDPEVPVLSVNDLGIVRNIIISKPGKEVEVEITPTYSGCPAMDMIAMNIRLQLTAEGYENVKITKVLFPAWTTDWMSEHGKQKLKAYGIAPPDTYSKKNSFELFAVAEKVQCPLCNSFNTSMISEFGSTACKSLYRCNDCREPFDVFKCH